MWHNGVVEQQAFIHHAKKLFRRRRFYTFLFIICGVLAYLINTLYDGTLIEIGAISLGVTSLFCGLRMLRAGDELERTIWDDFVKSNKITITPQTTRPLQGAISEIGDSRLANTVFEGNYQNIQVRLLKLHVNYYSDRRGGYLKTYRVFEIYSKRSYHHVYLDSKRNNNDLSSTMSFLRSSIKENPQIQTEGDFNSYFSVFVPPNSTFNGLMTLTPDALLILRDLAKPFDVEFVGNSIYIISDDRLKSVEDILIYQRNIIDLVSELSSNIVRTRDIQEKPMLVSKTPSLR